MGFGNDIGTVLFSDDIADSVQVEYPKNTTRIQIQDITFELESIRYKKNNIKTIKVFGNINSILSLMEQDSFEIHLIINDEQKYKFNKNDIDDLQINNISTNCNIIINLVD